jgi:hypothetical protein
MQIAILGLGEAGRHVHDMEAVVSILESADIQPFMSQASCNPAISHLNSE